MRRRRENKKWVENMRFPLTVMVTCLAERDTPRAACRNDEIDLKCRTRKAEAWNRVEWASMQDGR
jgi:hypothetical protein